jgi:hypothetical protein
LFAVGNRVRREIQYIREASKSEFSSKKPAALRPIITRKFGDFFADASGIGLAGGPARRGRGAASRLAG